MARQANTESPQAVLDPDRALVPAVVRANAEKVRRGFWPKLARTATRIPFAAEATAVWFCARDPQTPAAAKGILLAALAYFVVPVDLIPDMLAGIGFTDDAAVIAAVLATLGSHVKPRHRDEANRALERARRAAAD